MSLCLPLVSDGCPLGKTSLIWNLKPVEEHAGETPDNRLDSQKLVSNTDNVLMAVADVHALMAQQRSALLAAIKFRASCLQDVLL